MIYAREVKSDSKDNIRFICSLDGSDEYSVLYKKYENIFYDSDNSPITDEYDIYFLMKIVDMICEKIKNNEKIDDELSFKIKKPMDENKFKSVIFIFVFTLVMSIGSIGTCDEGLILTFSLVFLPIVFVCAFFLIRDFLIKKEWKDKNIPYKKKDIVITAEKKDFNNIDGVETVTLKSNKYGNLSYDNVENENIFFWIILAIFSILITLAGIISLIIQKNLFGFILITIFFVPLAIYSIKRAIKVKSVKKTTSPLNVVTFIFACSLILFMAIAGFTGLIMGLKPDLEIDIGKIILISFSITFGIGIFGICFEIFYYLKKITADKNK